MYSVEEREEALELYFKYGCKASLVIRELGYPRGRKSLVSWAKEYKATGEAMFITLYVRAFRLLAF